MLTNEKPSTRVKYKSGAKLHVSIRRRTITAREIYSHNMMPTANSQHSPFMYTCVCACFFFLWVFVCAVNGMLDVCLLPADDKNLFIFINSVHLLRLHHLRPDGCRAVLRTICPSHTHVVCVLCVCVHARARKKGKSQDDAGCLIRFQNSLACTSLSLCVSLFTQISNLDKSKRR